MSEGRLFDPPPPEQSPGARRPAGWHHHGGKLYREPVSRDQLFMVGRCVDDYVPADAEVRAVARACEGLPYAALEAGCPGGGAPRYRRRIMAQVLFFAYMEGVRSCREIAGRLERDLHYIWLAQGEQMSYHTLSDFRRDFLPALQTFFVEVVRHAIKLDLVGMKLVAIDGTKIAAQARKESYTADDLERTLERVGQEIAAGLAEAVALDEAQDRELGEAGGEEQSELADRLERLQAKQAQLQAAQEALAASGRERVCPSDLEATVQTTDRGTRPGYNAQAAVDDKVQIILSCSVTTDQNDSQQFMPVAEDAIAVTGMVPETFVADTGYQSPEAQAGIQAAGFDAYINQKNLGGRAEFQHQHFQYDAQQDRYLCPQGRTLRRRGDKRLRKREYRFYRAQTTCRDCPLRDRCLSPKARYRELLISDQDPLTLAMRQKVATARGQEVLQCRRQTVEPVFGVIKDVMGLRQFRLKGLAGATLEFGICAIAHNLGKIARHLSQGGSLPAACPAAS
jgi:transposase